MMSNAEDRGQSTPLQIDWARWMRGLGQRKREAREFLGLSQEQLARMAGVSQGAISRLEAGRGLATPLLVVLKIAIALRQALSGIDPELLSDEMRGFMNSPNLPPRVMESIPVLRDACLEELIRLYSRLPARQREKLLAVTRTTAEALDEP